MSGTLIGSSFVRVVQIIRYRATGAHPPIRVRRTGGRRGGLSVMPNVEHPAVVAYDGSAEARAAIEAAVGLFGRRRLIVVSVWEPGLAQAMAPLRDPTGMGYM